MASTVGEVLDQLVPLFENRINLKKLSTVSEQRLVPFVGAGLSVPFGFPGWTTFLSDAAAKAGVSDEVSELFVAGDYEGACACIAGRLGRAVFENLVEDAFGRPPDDVPLAAVAVLPRIARGPVITTNFDHVLETVYRNSGHPFEQVLWGARSSAVASTLYDNNHYLLKIHGDVTDRTDRVFTKSDYLAQYGSEDPDSFDYALPLPAALRRMFTTRSILFLGCSLQHDRTTHLLESLAADDHEIPLHFAVIEMPSNTAAAQERLRVLSESNILPIVYRTSFHDDVRAILEALTEPESLRRVTRDEMTAGFAADPGRLLNQAEAERLFGAFASAAARYEALFTGEDTDMDIRAQAGAALALCEYQLGNLETALSTLDATLDRFTTWLSPETRFIAEITRPSVLFALGRWDTAQAAFHKLIARAGTLDSRQRCEIYKRSNMFLLHDDAMTYLRGAEAELAEDEQDPLYWELRHNIACNLMLVGEIDEAKNLFESCLQPFRTLSPYRLVYPLNNLGIIDMRQGRIGNARRHFREIMGMQVTLFEHVSAECHLAILDVLTGRLERAQNTLAALARRVESSSEAILQDLVFHNLAWVEHLRGDDDRALRHLRHGIPIRRNLWFDLRRALRDRVERQITHSTATQPAAMTPRRDIWLFETEWEFSELWFWE
ncbi:MAG: SIR2 family protein [Acidobacteriota bacterium]|nr:SIR2 family protein [Acidobacteriota bacterium]